MNEGFSRTENAQRLVKWAFKAQQLSYRDNAPNFKERDVWEASIGHGVGSEVYGKSDLFKRPVLVLKKFNNGRFLGVPFTSNPLYGGLHVVEIVFNDIHGAAMLDQASTYDSARLIKKIGMLDKPTFDVIRRKSA